MQAVAHAIIVGSGQAGFATASALRTEGFGGRITMIGGEPIAAYQRPPLSKGFLLGTVDDSELLLRPAAYFREQQIDVRLGCSATGLDATSSTVHLDDGASLDFDMLVLATGAEPRTLPADVADAMDGVVTLRTVADAVRLREQLRPGRAMVIIGGGYIGLEVAATAAKSGMTVTVIEAADRVLQRVACVETSNEMRSLHAAHGVTIVEGRGVKRVVGDAHVRAVELSDGQVVNADVVVVAIGVIPLTALAADAGLTVDNGIAVDSQMRTSASTIWAVGDCAAFEFRGRRHRIESVGNAIDTGAIAAASMLGRGEDYRPIPWFWSDQYDCRLKIAGHLEGYDSVHVRVSASGRSHWYYRGDELLAVDSIDDARSHAAARRLLATGHSPDPWRVSDATIDLSELVRS